MVGVKHQSINFVCILLMLKYIRWAIFILNITINGDYLYYVVEKCCNKMYFTHKPINHVKISRRDIAEILLKLALSANQSIQSLYIRIIL